VRFHRSHAHAQLARISLLLCPSAIMAAPAVRGSSIAAPLAPSPRGFRQILVQNNLIDVGLKNGSPLSTDSIARNNPPAARP